MDSGTAAAAPFYRAEFGFRIREADELAAMHREAGFGAAEIDAPTVGVGFATLRRGRRRYI